MQQDSCTPVVSRTQWASMERKTAWPTETVMRSRPFAYLASIAALAALYFGAAKLGLSLATLAEQVTLVWPATGIALAALLLFGYRMWPGIALGAFLANAT